MIGVIEEQENCSTNSFTVIKKTGYPRIVRHERFKIFNIHLYDMYVKIYIVWRLFEMDIDLRNVINKMGSDFDENIKIIEKTCGNINNISLHTFAMDKFSSYTQWEIAIITLLKKGINPNITNSDNRNFIQSALGERVSCPRIEFLIDEGMKYGLNVNHVDDFGKTIFHYILESSLYCNKFNFNSYMIRIYNKLIDYGFDIDKFDGKAISFDESINLNIDKEVANDVIEFFKGRLDIVSSSTMLDKEIRKMKIDQLKKRSNDMHETAMDSLTKFREESDKTMNNDIKELEKFGKVLNEKKYLSSPTIGRDNELKNLMVTLAQDKKNPIIVGESGVGKTALVDELAYRIQNDHVPSFLKDKIIYEVDPSLVVEGAMYVGEFERKMNEMLSLCEKYNVILFIDEIHTIYGIGAGEHKLNDMAGMLKYYIDRNGLKVIGTTTEKEYQQFFANDALKRRFEKVVVKEPDISTLEIIINKKIDDYCLKSNLSFESEEIKKNIIDVIVVATDNKNRVYDDKVNNPDLAISIIDKAFAFAKYYDSDYIKSEHFVESFKYCDRIYDSARKEAISRLNKKIDVGEQRNAKILTVDFNKFRR